MVYHNQKNAYYSKGGAILSKVTAKYQITIPPEVRNELGIVPGNEVEITKRGNQFVIVVDPIKDLKKKWRGKFKGRRKTDEYMDELRGNVD
jgi:AbrB family looped-hinge helix DNA binding protein